MNSGANREPPNAPKRQLEDSGGASSRKLLKVGEASASKTDGDGRTELHRAAEEGKEWRLRELLAQGFDARARDRKGNTPLLSALGGYKDYRKEVAAELLLDADPGGINLQNNLLYSPLHLAAGMDYLRLVKKLVAAGADTRLRDWLGETPIHKALFRWREPAAKFLVGADCGNNIPDHGGRTPLHLAAERGYERIVAKLVAAGGNLLVRDSSGCTPLHKALIFGNLAAAELLVEKGGENDFPDGQGRTPLHLAQERGYERIVAKLVAAGGNVTCP